MKLKIRFYYLLFLGLFFGFVGVFSTTTYAALNGSIDSHGPSTDSSSLGRSWFAVGNGGCPLAPNSCDSGFEGPNTFIDIYSKQSPPIKINFQNPSGGCSSSVDSYSDSLSSTKFYFYANGGIFKTLSYKNNGAVCGTTPDIILNQASPVNISGSTWYRVRIRVDIGSNKPFLENSFRLNIVSNVSTSYVSIAARQDNFFTGLYQKDSPGLWDQAIDFAPPNACKAPNGKVQGTLAWYDADWKQYNKNLTIRLQKAPKGTNNWTNLNPNNPNVGLYSGEQQIGDSGPSSLRQYNINFDIAYKYRVVWRNIAPINTVQIRLPFDQIYSKIPFDCPVDLCTDISGVQSSVPSGRIKIPNDATTPGSCPPLPTGSISYNCIANNLTLNLNSGGSGPVNGYVKVIGSGDLNFGASKNFSISGSSTINFSGWTNYVDPNIPHLIGLYAVIGGIPDIKLNSTTAGGGCPYYPYFQTFNADVVAGGAFASGDTCNVGSAPKAGILAYINPLSSHNSGGTSGSGSQLGSFASDTIKGFISSTLNSNASSHNALTAGGISSLDNTDTYAKTGDGFNQATATCVPDYYGETQLFDPTKKVIGSGSIVQEGSNNDGKQIFYSGQTVVDINGQYSGKRTYYVDGDVYIKSNVMYNDTFPAGKIPNFSLVVKGNIIISAGVTRLDGVYIAQPDGSSKGIIYTCGNSGANPYPYTTATDVYNNCRSNQLIINGAVIAKRVVLSRALNSIDQSKYNDLPDSTKAAEVFKFSPELYLSPPLFRDNTGGSSNVFDSIGLLPPIL